MNATLLEARRAMHSRSNDAVIETARGGTVQPAAAPPTADTPISARWTDAPVSTGRPEAPIRDRRAMVAWLNVVAALIVLTLIVGGATRITGSGLSITDWKPISGVVPPMTQAAWEAEFEAYRQIPQYQMVNPDMSLDGFKRIFWWEWAHRISGRLIGVVFAVPMLVFLLRGGKPGWLQRRLLLLFGLGGLQGAIGWWMVASGLVDRVSVSHYRLAVHLTLACVLLALTVWTAKAVAAAGRPAPSDTAPSGGLSTDGRSSGGLSVGAIALLALLLVQIALGGLVAGLDAGLAWNTWPLMDRSLIPAGLLFERPWWINFFENRLTVQFDHRVAGYLLLAVAGWHAVRVVRAAGWSRPAVEAAALFLLILAQALIGIHVVVWNVPPGLALAHQATAAVLVWLAAVHAFEMTHRHPAHPATAPVWRRR